MVEFRKFTGIRGNALDAGILNHLMVSQSEWMGREESADGTDLAGVVLIVVWRVDY